MRSILYLFGTENYLVCILYYCVHLPGNAFAHDQYAHLAYKMEVIPKNFKLTNISFMKFSYRAACLQYTWHTCIFACGLRRYALYSFALLFCQYLFFFSIIHSSTKYPICKLCFLSIQDNNVVKIWSYDKRTYNTTVSLTLTYCKDWTHIF